MHVRHIKILCTLASTALSLFGIRDVHGYFQAQEVDLHGPIAERVAAALANVKRVPPERKSLVSYEEVQRGWHGMNWTGYQPPAPIAVLDEDVAEPRVAVSELISVLMIQVDTDDAKQSSASISYRSAARVVPLGDAVGQDLRVDDTLLAPHESAKVVSITLEGIEFEFTDSDRENEIVAPSHVLVAGDRIIPVMNGELPSAPAQANRFGKRRGETVELTTGAFRIGKEDQANLAANYPTLLSQEVRHRRHFNSKTRRYDGIEIQSVTPGGFASRHGAQAGDVIRSINGHPVTSVAEAVAYVREHDHEFDTWEVEVENQGKTRTVVYESPSAD